jgi:hypothetical protein
MLMTIESPHEARRERRPMPVGAGMRHGSSKMLESYLGDIEYLIRERQWTEAVPLALALPHICAALADPGLRSSRAAFLAWCESWVRPPKADMSMSALSPDVLYRMACETTSELDGLAAVPVEALRQLRLRRLSRAAPPRRRVSLQEMTEIADAPAREACVALLDGVRRWYSDWAALDPTVQNNLARLAVLR